MRDSPRHHPRPRPRHVEKLRVGLPPQIVLPLQRRQSLPAVLRITFHKLQPHFLLWQRRRTHINPKHVAEPQVFAHALMHHLLQHAAPSRVILPRPNAKILIPKLAPHAHHLHSLGGICLDEKCVSHSRKCYPNFPNSIHAPRQPSPRRHRHRRHLHRLRLDRPRSPAHAESISHSRRSLPSHCRGAPKDKSRRRVHYPARHHRRHQRTARTQRSPHRSNHHRRIRRRHRDRTPAPSQTLRLFLRPHRTISPPRSPLRYRRTRLQQRRNPKLALAREAGIASRTNSHGTARVHRHLVALLVRESKKRIGNRGSSQASRRPTLDLAPDSPGIPRIRTHLNRSNQCLPATSNAALPGKSTIPRGSPFGSKGSHVPNHKSCGSGRLARAPQGGAALQRCKKKSKSERAALQRRKSGRAAL